MMRNGLRLPDFMLFFALLAALAACTQSLRERGNTGSAEDARGTLIGQADPAFVAGLASGQIEALARSEQQALNFGTVGEEQKWRSGSVEGTVSAGQPFRVGQSTCRSFAHSLTRAGSKKNAASTACRRGNSVWKIVS